MPEMPAPAIIRSQLAATLAMAQNLGACKAYMDAGYPKLCAGGIDATRAQYKRERATLLALIARTLADTDRDREKVKPVTCQGETR